MPWRCYGLNPDVNQRAQINSIQDEGQRGLAHRNAGYGLYKIDDVVRLEKPDGMVALEDSWGFGDAPNRKWSRKLNPFYHCTIDSLKFLDDQLDLAHKAKNLCVWASFAEEEYHRLGYTHVRTIPGCIDPEEYYPIDKDTRKKLRQKHGLDDYFLPMFLGRSQLRKQIPQLLEGFRIFTTENPQVKTKLILHCSAGEGWDIPQLMRNNGLPIDSVLMTHYCKACRQYQLIPFEGQGRNCPMCGAEKSFETTNIVHGVSEEQLCEIYAISDFVLNPISSGGYEFSSFQAKMCSKIVATTSYSCGLDACSEESGGLPLDWSPYYEPSTVFIKATTLPTSIAETMARVYDMSPEEREEMETRAYNWAINYCSVDAVGKKFEELILAQPEVEWEDSDFEPARKNPNYQPPPNLSSEEFVLSLFNHMLDANVDKSNKEVKFWINHLNKTRDYQGTYNHFKNLAAQHNAALDNKPKDLADFLDPTDDKRMCVVMPQSAGDVLIVNSLVKQVAELYPEFRIYFVTMPQFRPLIEGHPNVHRVLDYAPCFDDIFFLEGRGENKGYFDIALLPHGQTQKFFTYQHADNEFRAEWLKDKTTA